MNLPAAVHDAIMADQLRVAELELEKRPRLSYADRVRMHPRAGDLFTVAGHYEKLWFEVEYVSSPWVFYRKWSPEHPVRQNCKVRLGAWRDNLANAKIEKAAP